LLETTLEADKGVSGEGRVDGDIGEGSCAFLETRDLFLLISDDMGSCARLATVARDDVKKTDGIS